MNKHATIILNITHRCNLRCTYCYYQEAMTEITGDFSLSLLETIFKKAAESPYNSFDFNLHGGEPLLLKIPYFEQIFQLQEQYLAGKTYTNSIQTNGTCITRDFIDFYKKVNRDRNRLKLGISLDGPREIHDKNRVFESGTGSHARIMTNLKALEENDIKVGIIGVCSKDTLESGQDLYAFFKTIGNLETLNILLDDAFKAEDIAANQLGAFLNRTFSDWYQDEGAFFTITHFESIIRTMLGKSGLICCLSPNCFEHNNLISIDPDGGVSPCDSFAEVKLGSIYEKSLEKLISQNMTKKKLAQKEQKRLDNCRFCRWFRFCHSNCPRTERVDQVSVLCGNSQSNFAFIQAMLSDTGIIKEKEFDYTRINAIPNPVLRKKLSGFLS